MHSQGYEGLHIETFTFCMSAVNLSMVSTVFIGLILIVFDFGQKGSEKCDKKCIHRDMKGCITLLDAGCQEISAARVMSWFHMRDIILKMFLGFPRLDFLIFWHFLCEI